MIAGAGRFVLAATGGRPERARAYLEAEPGLVADPWAALVLGRRWEGDVHRPRRAARLAAAGLRGALGARRRRRAAVPPRAAGG